MAQPVKIRAAYREDAAHLLRLEEAIAKDGRQSEDWRKQTCQTLRDLSVRLLQAKGGPIVEVEGPAESKPAARASSRK